MVSYGGLPVEQENVKGVYIPGHQTCLVWSYALVKHIPGTGIQQAYTYCSSCHTSRRDIQTRHQDGKSRRDVNTDVSTDDKA